MNGLPPRLSPGRLLAGIVLPLAEYLLIRAAIGSATGALEITEAAPAAWMIVVGIARRRLNRERQPEIEARLADGERRRAVTMLTAIVGLTLTIDGPSQIALARTVPTGTFVADSTAARVVVFGTGLIATLWYFRYQKERREKGPRPPASFERGG